MLIERTPIFIKYNLKRSNKLQKRYNQLRNRTSYNKNRRKRNHNELQYITTRKRRGGIRNALIIRV